MFYLLVPHPKAYHFPFVYSFSSLSDAISFCLSPRHCIFILFNSSFCSIFYRGSISALQSLFLDFHDKDNPYNWRFFNEP